MHDDSHRGDNTNPGLTSGATDAETGGPGGDRYQEIIQEIAALDAMYERGLIDTDDYQQRRAELEAERDANRDDC